MEGEIILASQQTFLRLRCKNSEQDSFRADSGPGQSMRNEP